MGTIFSAVLGGIVGALNYERTRTMFLQRRILDLAERQEKMLDEVLVQWELCTKAMFWMSEQLEEDVDAEEILDGYLERIQFMNLAIQYTEPK